MIKNIRTYNQASSHEYRWWREAALQAHAGEIGGEGAGDHLTHTPTALGGGYFSHFQIIGTGPQRALPQDPVLVTPARSRALACSGVYLRPAPPPIELTYRALVATTLGSPWDIS
jgi:hypothetical protein